MNATTFKLPFGLTASYYIERITGCLATVIGRIGSTAEGRSLVRAEVTFEARMMLGFGLCTERIDKETVLSAKIPGLMVWLTFPFSVGKAKSYEDDSVAYSFDVSTNYDVGLPDLVFRWCLGVSGDSWSATDPQRWRNSSWCLSDLLGGFGHKTEDISSKILVAPLPEGLCEVEVYLKRSITYWRWMPFLQNRGYTAVVKPKGMVFVQGKGTSEWNCGEERLPEVWCSERTYGDAVGAFVKRVLSYREERSGLSCISPGRCEVHGADSGIPGAEESVSVLLAQNPDGSVAVLDVEKGQKP